MVESYEEITQILKEIEQKFRMRSIFISGSAEEYGEWGRERAVKLVHKLSAKLVSKQYRIVNGFGWGIGSAVINGALEQIYKNPKKHSEEQLVIKPFPQFATGDKELSDLWKEYRERMISLTGIAIFLFGNKKNPENESEIVLAGGVKKEFEIALKVGCIPIPIGSTGYMASQLWDEIKSDITKYFVGIEGIEEDLNILQQEQQADKVIASVVRIVEAINKN